MRLQTNKNNWDWKENRCPGSYQTNWEVTSKYMFRKH